MLYPKSPQAYYLAELAQVAWGLLPIAIILIAVIFLRRRERTRRTMLLQLSAAFWLVVAGASQVTLNHAVGLQIFPRNHIFSSQDESARWDDFYMTMFHGLHLAEQIA